jgi:ATP-dependent DNA ligase
MMAERAKALSSTGRGLRDYYYPNLPNRVAPNNPFFLRLDNDPEWVAGVKKNGWHVLIDSRKANMLWTRNKTEIPDRLTELRREIALLIPENTIVDGELIHKRTINIKGRLYLFDIIVYRGKELHNLPLRERRKYLDDIMCNNVCPEIEKEIQVQIGKRLLYEQSIQAEDEEGIVIKKLSSKYLIGISDCITNPFWIKVKKDEAHLYRR